MPSLRVKNIDENTMQRLQTQAAMHGTSVEEEVRQIIERALSKQERLGDLAVRLFSPVYDNDELVLPERDFEFCEIEPVNPISDKQ
tara:strand:+ start:2548 stop:2805 length:258 start_codon:yes stop_codon:yes gene_type:complete